MDQLIIDILRRFPDLKSRMAAIGDLDADTILQDFAHQTVDAFADDGRRSMGTAYLIYMADRLSQATQEEVEMIERNFIDPMINYGMIKE